VLIKTDNNFKLPKLDFYVNRHWHQNYFALETLYSIAD